MSLSLILSEEEKSCVFFQIFGQRFEISNSNFLDVNFVPFIKSETMKRDDGGIAFLIFDRSQTKITRTPVVVVHHRRYCCTNRGGVISSDDERIVLKSSERASERMRSIRVLAFVF